MDIRAFLKKRNISQAQFGTLVGVSQSMVSQWLEWVDDPSRGTRITAERAIDIEQKTNGAIRRHELRPDIFRRSAA